MKMFTFNQKQDKSYQQGFTLMEVMVAVSIFAIVVTVGIGSLLTINSTYKKSQADRQAIDGLTFTLESMSRRLRTAREWDPNSVYGQPTDSFMFVDQDGATVTYSWGGENNPKIYMDYQCNGSCQNPVLADSSTPYEMTSTNVIITEMTFLPLQATGGQPYVQINVSGTVTNGKQVADFSFQTGVSKRTLER